MNLKNSMAAVIEEFWYRTDLLNIKSYDNFSFVIEFDKYNIFLDFFSSEYPSILIDYQDLYYDLINKSYEDVKKIYNYVYEGHKALELKNNIKSLYLDEVHYLFSIYKKSSVQYKIKLLWKENENNPNNFLLTSVSKIVNKKFNVSKPNFMQIIIHRPVDFRKFALFTLKSIKFLKPLDFLGIISIYYGIGKLYIYPENGYELMEEEILNLPNIRNICTVNRFLNKFPK